LEKGKRALEKRVAGLVCCGNYSEKERAKKTGGRTKTSRSKVLPAGHVLGYISKK